MPIDFKTSHRSKEWNEGFAQFREYGNNPTERNPYPEGSRAFSEYHQGFLAAYLEEAQQWTTRSGCK